MIAEWQAIDAAILPRKVARSFRRGGVLAGASSLLDHFGKHALQLAAFESDRGGFDRESSRAEGFSFEAVALQFVGDIGKTAICHGCRSTSKGMSRRWR